ncbi:cofactor assembly of complex C isoform X2 [Tasmannia lanceolata]|uniref:cofactor assembly of complex C isoform X2 n=1 Tax=Tasmannia lanceolata TaxID=3420 RepID=UPI004063B6F7
METGSLLRPVSCFPMTPLRLISPFSTSIKASSSSSLQGKGKEKGNGSGVYKGPKPKRDLVGEWVSNNDNTVRQLPIIVGGLSLFTTLLNRTLSGVAPFSDASSSQSRTDILTLGLAVTNLLAGLVWLSIRPKYISAVTPQGVECRRISSDIPDCVVPELIWAWESLSVITCCRSFVIVYGNNCLLQIGIASESLTNCGDAVVVDPTRLIQGSLYQGVIKSGTQSYLANLSLYPGRSELPFLPSNTQAVILQPLGEKGIAIIGGDTVRGFTTVDQQAWITLIAEKLDASFSKIRSMSTSNGEANF